jgi:bifunctional UDP-N-acetylglucosamine pyrophosphorylase/glucosamine-1-phosphate N-acetyltransferase
MKSTKPKVLHEVLGLTLLDHVLHAASDLSAKKTLVIVGHGRDQVQDHLAKAHPAVVTAVQDEQNGTGHAVKIAVDALGELTGPVLVLAGDTPLLTTSDMQLTLDALAGKSAAVLTAHVTDATGYGRIVRSASNDFEKIVEWFARSDEELEEYSQNCGGEIEEDADYPCIFSEVAASGNFDRPKASPSEYYQPDINEAYFNEILSERLDEI